MIGAWILNEGGGNGVFNSVDHSQGAVISGTTWVGEDLYCGAADVGVNLGTNPKYAFTSEKFSLVTRIRFPAICNLYDHIFCKGVGDEGGFGLGISDHIGLMLYFWTVESAGVTYSAQTSSEAYANNAIMDIVVVKSGISVAIYCNGVDKKASGQACSTITHSGHNYDMYFGRRSSASFGFDGYLKHLFIYNDALTQADVTSLYEDAYQQWRPSLKWWAGSISEVYKDFTSNAAVRLSAPAWT